MSCPFYTWRSDFYCVKQQKEVGEDIYYRYCRNYDYSECPIYCDEGEVTGCFLTSACVEAMGLTDDCRELTVLRRFRDEWLSKQSGGKEDIKEYYQIAPVIVSLISKRNNSECIFRSIYQNMVRPAVILIQEKKMCQAWSLYKDEVMKLKVTYFK